ncbi:tetraspanin-33-like [Dermacentor variabilis]|uniref:tetraspanin-33-like n=1 Tax=Dermacentor variabilis TaxID=34621 RepID=UPI003F5B1B56
MVERSHEISFRNRSLLVSFMVNLEVTAFIVSGILAVVSFLGFVGALRENVCFLRWYIRGLTGLDYFSKLLAVGSLGLFFVSTSSAESLFSIDMIVSYRDNADYARLVDTAQASFQCCGVTSERYRDWGHNIYFNCSKSNPSTERCSVPASCCRPPEGENPDLETRLRRRFCGRGVLAGTEQEAWHKIFTRNCVDATVSYLRGNAFVILGVSLVLTVMFAVLSVVATRVHDEVISLTRLYDDYYRKREIGYRKSLAQMEALNEVRAARDRLVGKKGTKDILPPG